MTLGARFEAEIREQPAVWRRIAASDNAARLARAFGECDGVVLVGSGSSLFVAQLGALALRRRALSAHALPASEARFDAAAYGGACVVALSQSGRSADVLDALDRLAPARVVALTNDVDAPLAERADLVIDCLAGPEVAVPASKSVSAMAVLVLWAATLAADGRGRDAEALAATAEGVDAWLRDGGADEVVEAAQELVALRALAIVGAGYGVPIAREIALKLKEASYVPAEGFAAGEFRHGSSAMLDGATGIVGIADAASRAIVERPLIEAARAGAVRRALGDGVAGLPALGPRVHRAFTVLGWLVAGQLLALALGRARGVDADAPRGLTKFVR